MIVLDTRALIWWVNDDGQLSDRARKAIEREISSENEQVFISTITAWEIALLVEKGRLTLTMDVKDWIDTVTAIEGVRFVPVDNEVAIQSVRLPGEFHPDPADRIIVALARRLSAALVTSDAKILAYKQVKTIW
jgi:PIN domain nuclease of toxin-antitoxin system